MHSILFVLQQPDESDTRGMPFWNEALKNLHSWKGKTEAVERLAPNVWLLHVSGGLPFLGSAIQLAEQSKLPYRMLFLKKDKWIHSSYAA
jgi:hypothetical protein